MENQLPVTTQLLGSQHGGGEAGAVLLASRAPLSILGYLGLVLCVVLDLMKEGCAHRGIYSVHRDRGLRIEGDCAGPSLRCLPGWCLRLGERIKTGAHFDWLPRALPRPRSRAGMLLAMAGHPGIEKAPSWREVTCAAFSSCFAMVCMVFPGVREMRIRARGIEGNFPSSSQEVK